MVTRGRHGGLGRERPVTEGPRIEKIVGYKLKALAAWTLPPPGPGLCVPDTYTHRGKHRLSPSKHTSKPQHSTYVTACIDMRERSLCTTHVLKAHVPCLCEAITGNPIIGDKNEGQTADRPRAKLESKYIRLKSQYQCSGTA